MNKIANQFLRLTSSLVLTWALFFPLSNAAARDANQITDWYIEDFQSEIIVNKDSSLDITEKIVADCGNLPDKHGIFRVLPLFYQKSESERVKTPITLQSITDFNDKPHKYDESKTRDTVTWKIGDPNISVSGKNNYKITYHVENAIRFSSPDFDEFYWNLSGNFWEIEIDKFVGTIIFPPESEMRTVDLYSGQSGKKDNSLANYSRNNEHSLIINSLRPLKTSEGITLSATFSKNTFLPYQPSFWQRYGNYLWLLLPLLAFWLGFSLWKKHGRDPKLSMAEMTQYEPPKGLGPIETGMVLSNLSLRNHFLSAGIISLAVKKVLTIEEIEKKGILGQKDFKITFKKKDFSSLSELTETEKELAEKLHSHTKGDVLRLSELKNEFYTSIPLIKSVGEKFLYEKKYFNRQGFAYRIVLIVIMIVSIFALVWPAAAIIPLIDSPAIA
ncbi:MAG TPA: DUF2207 domain-containing protein, partial [bacterium]|nr:DUF2207 domain-containing protein [bacterium]